MPKHDTEFTIEACPVCGEKHTYQLQLGTSYLFRGRPEKGEIDGTRYLKIILECPVKNISFKAEIALPMETYLLISEVKAPPKR